MNGLRQRWEDTDNRPIPTECRKVRNLHSALVKFFWFFPEFFERVLLWPTKLGNGRHLPKVLFGPVTCPVFVQQSPALALVKTEYRRISFPLAKMISTLTQTESVLC